MRSLWFIPVLCLMLSFEAFSQDAEPAVTINDATSIKAKVYKFAVSTSAECTNPTTIFESASGIEADLITKPSFGKGKIANGTYRCLMVEVSKIVNTTGPGGCTTPKDNLICADGQQSKLVSGTNVTCAGGATSDQRVAIYFNTLSTNNSGNRVLLPPISGTDTTSGVTLNAPLVFPTNNKGSMKIKKSIIKSDNCTLDGVTFSFTSP